MVFVKATNMKKRNPVERRKDLDKKDLKALAEWLRSDGRDAFRSAIESKSEVEKLVEQMSVIDDKAVKEPYTV